MKQLIKMLRELDLNKNSIEDIRNVLDFVAFKLEQEKNELIKFIKETKEYYSDGIDEELIDMIKGE